MDMIPHWVCPLPWAGGPMADFNDKDFLELLFQFLQASIHRKISYDYKVEVWHCHSYLIIISPHNCPSIIHIIGASQEESTHRTRRVMATNRISKSYKIQLLKLDNTPSTSQVIFEVPFKNDKQYRIHINRRNLIIPRTVTRWLF